MRTTRESPEGRWVVQRDQNSPSLLISVGGSEESITPEEALFLAATLQFMAQAQIEDRANNPDHEDEPQPKGKA